MFPIWLLMILLLSPTVYASPESGAFPDIPFQMFNNFITQNFNANISLSTVFLIFFTLIENPDLLNLHARQKIKVVEGERGTKATGWLKCLAYALYAVLFSAPLIPEGVTGLRRSPQEWDRTPPEWDWTPPEWDRSLQEW
jgi:hypothetical protein